MQYREKDQYAMKKNLEFQVGFTDITVIDGVPRCWWNKKQKCFHYDGKVVQHCADARCRIKDCIKK